MKNKEIRALLAAAMSVTLVFGNAGVAEAANATKEETVYVKTDAEGNETSVTVSDQLKNVGDLGSIEDISHLLDIENVKGDEAFSQSGDSITWTNDGSREICYQGTTKEKLPVGMKITYELDGKSVKADELKGKSGHLKIHVAYENGTSGEEFTPFLMATGIILKEDVFANVTIDHGKMISDGEKQVAVGYGIPGLKEYLDIDNEKLSELEIPESFTMEADVTDYDGITCMSLATNSVFSEATDKKIDGLDDLEDSMNELQDASNQLVDGSGELKDGTGTLLASSGDLIDGVKQLADGGLALKDGTHTLAAGASALSKGAGELWAGTGALMAGSKSLVAGAEQVAAGTTSAKNGAAELSGGLSLMQQSVAGMKSDTASGLGQLYAGAGRVVDGIAQAKGGADQVAAGVADAIDGANQVAGGASNLKGEAGDVSCLAKKLKETLPAASVQKEVNVTVTVDNSDVAAEVAAALRSAGVDEDAISAAVSKIRPKTVTTTATVAVETDTATAAQIADQIAAKGNGIAKGLDIVAGGASNLAGKLGDLKNGATQVAAGLSEEGELSKGAVALQSGINMMGDSLGKGTDELLGGIGQLQAGSSALSDGLIQLEAGAGQLSEGSKTLDAGIGAANQGAKQLSEGAGALEDGTLTLDLGAITLSDGLGTLHSGSLQLVDGVKLLDEGAGKLHDGMVEFNEEGIQELTKLFDGDLESLFDKLNAMLDNAKEYKSYSGINEGMDGEVKFIFMTEE